jgi:hypothetical protein
MKCKYLNTKLFFEFIRGKEKMKKVLVGFFIIVMLLLPPVTANTFITQNKDSLEEIYNNLIEKIENAESKEEIKIIYKEALVELEKNDLLGRNKANDVYNLMFEDDNSITVHGESTKTYFLGRAAVFFYKYSQLSNIWKPFAFLSEFIWRLCLQADREAFIHTGSWIIYGRLYRVRYYLYDTWPAEGYVKIVDSGDEIDYTTPFYGHLTKIEIANIQDPGGYFIYCVGIKGFKGFYMGGYYFGTAEKYDIRNQVPDL